MVTWFRLHLDWYTSSANRCRLVIYCNLHYVIKNLNSVKIYKLCVF